MWKSLEIVFIAFQFNPMNDSIDNSQINSGCAVSKAELFEDAGIWVLCVTHKNLPLQCSTQLKIIHSGPANLLFGFGLGSSEPGSILYSCCQSPFWELSGASK